MKKLAFFAILCLCSCSKAWYDARDDRKLEELAIRRESTFLQLSNKLNPCFQGKAKSDTVTQHDTTQLAGDTSTVTVHDTVRTTIKLPGKKIVNTVTIRDTIPDTRGIAAMQAKYNDCNAAQIATQQKFDDKDAESRKFKWLFYSLAGLVLVYIALKVYKTFTGGAALGAVSKIL